MSCLGLQGVELQLCRAAEAAEQAAAAAQSLRQQRGAVDVLAALADAVAALLLPLLLVFAMWRLWPVLRGIFESRKFTIKLAGFELSAQEATDQLRQQIDDLQAKVAALQAEAARPAAPLDLFPGPPEDLFELPKESGPAPAPPPPAPAAQRRILWVDDNPGGNAALIASFEAEGVAVETVRSSREAVGWLWSEPQHFAAVITDQGRNEDGRYKPDAGTALIRELRGGDINVPVAVFTNATGVRTGREALEAGAEIVTASAVDLRAFVARHTGSGSAD